MADINLLDGSPVSNDLLAELHTKLDEQIPGPFSDDTEAGANGVPVGGTYNQLGPVVVRMP